MDKGKISIPEVGLLKSYSLLFYVTVQLIASVLQLFNLVSIFAGRGTGATLLVIACCIFIGFIGQTTTTRWNYEDSKLPEEAEKTEDKQP